MAEATGPLASAAADLADEDLFSSLKFYKEYLFGDSEDFFRDRFLALEKNLNNAARGLSGSISKNTPHFTEHASPYLLGLARTVVRYPKKNTYNTRDHDSMLNVHRYFYMYVDRMSKINFGTLLEGSVKLDVSKRDIQDIFKHIESLYEDADKLLRLSVKFSEVGAYADADLNTHRPSEETHDWRGAIQGMRIYTRTCSVILDSVSAAYNFGMGNVKQALSICEKAAKKL